MSPSISVIICTHKPDAERLRRVVGALACQSLPRERWELVVVASEQLRPETLAMLAGDSARILVEPTRGITRARVRSYRETDRDLLLLVDDDNFVATDYLQACLEIAAEHPKLGVWGGQNLPEFEREPEPWTREYWPYLALRELDRDYWCNWPDLGKSPYGAGMCVRRRVVDHYLDQIARDPLRADLSGGEDNDLAFIACDIGLGMGLFRRLVLHHHMPENRLTERYLLQRLERAQRSCVWLEYLRNPSLGPPAVATLGQRLFHWYHRFRLAARPRRFLDAVQRGRAQGYADLQKLRNGQVPS